MNTMLTAKLSFLALFGATLWGLSQSDQIDPSAQRPEQRQAVDQFYDGLETDMEPLPANPAKPKPQTLNDSLLKRMSFAESGGNPNARSRTSSASGVMGFTNHTWKLVVKRYGKQTGIRMKDKNKPWAQKTMAALLMKENASALRKSLRRDPSEGEIYIAHVFGAADALKLIRAQGSGQPAARLFSEEVTTANRSIFWDGKTPRTVEEVYELLDDKINA